MCLTYSKLKYMFNITFINAFPCILKRIIPQGHWTKFALTSCWKSNWALPSFEGVVSKVMLLNPSSSIGANSILVTNQKSHLSHYHHPIKGNAIYSCLCNFQRHQLHQFHHNQFQMLKALALYLCPTNPTQVCKGVI